MRRVFSSVLFGFGAALVAAAVVSAQNPGGSSQGKSMKNPVPASKESIAAGQASFAKSCRACHGNDAKGNGQMAPKDSHPSDLTDQKWDRGGSDGEIFLVIRDGAGPEFKMKGQKGRMTDTDMWNIVNYVRSVGSKK